MFPDAAKSAGIIAEESMRLKELVDGILTISKIENDDMQMHPCRICLNDFVEEELGKLSIIGGAKRRI